MDDIIASLESITHTTKPTNKSATQKRAELFTERSPAAHAVEVYEYVPSTKSGESSLERVVRKEEKAIRKAQQVQQREEEARKKREEEELAKKMKEEQQ